VIKTGGEWVSSLQIEDIISQHPGVEEVAVIGVDDPKWGERPMAIVALRDRGLDADAIKAHVLAEAQRGVISKYAVPAHIVFVDRIDKTSVGKIDKKVLRQRHAVGAGAVSVSA